MSVQPKYMTQEKNTEARYTKVKYEAIPMKDNAISSWRACPQREVLKACIAITLGTLAGWEFFISLALYFPCMKTGTSRSLRFSEWFFSEDFHQILDMLRVCIQSTFSHCYLKHHFQWLCPINPKLWVSSMWVCIHSTRLCTGKTGYCWTIPRKGAIEYAKTWYPLALSSYIICIWKKS